MYRICVIDDVEGIRTLGKAFFERNGYEVTTASSADEGLQKTLALRPHAVLTDINTQSKLDGLQLAERINAHDKNTLIYVLSSVETGDQMDHLNALRKKEVVKRLYEKPADYGQMVKQITRDLNPGMRFIQKLF